MYENYWTIVWMRIVFTGVFFSYLKILNFCMLLMHFQGEEEEERKGGNKFEDSRWTENPAVTTTSPQAGDYREAAIEIKKGMNESMLMRTFQCHVNNPTITSV